MPNRMLYDDENNGESPIGIIAQSKWFKMKRKELRALRLRGEMDMVRSDWEKIQSDLKENHPEEFKALLRLAGFSDNLDDLPNFEDIQC